MKQLITIAFFAISGLSMAQNKENKGKNDKVLVGSWSGSEKDQQTAGLQKNWIQQRYEDGTFVLLYTIVQNCQVQSFVEKGQWWVDKGEFNELHFSSGKTDVYSYKVLDRNHVKFKARKLSIDHEVPDYEFIDTRVGEE